MQDDQIMQLVDQVESVMDRIRRAKPAHMEEGDLRPPERHMLWRIAMLENDGPLMPSEIAKQIGVTSAAITHHLNTLEEKGYVVRDASKDDRRVVCVQLTEQGREAVQKSKEAMRNRMRGMFEYLGAEDSTTLVSLLTKIGTYMAQEQPS